MDPTRLIGDIVERDSSAKKPVEPPSSSTSTTGQPAHRKRWTQSAFKQRQAAKAAGLDPSTIPNPSSKSNNQSAAESTPQSFENLDKQRIDRENKQKIDSMTPQEIAKAQEELLSGLNPALVQRLLARANIDEQHDPSPFDPLPEIQPTQPSPTIQVTDTTKEAVEHKDAVVKPTEPKPAPVPASNPTQSKKIADNYDEDQEPAQIPDDLFPLSDLRNQSTHFPAPPTLPDLDPSDPNFLATLHEKYFPELPADPSKLAWMAPVPTEDSPADRESAYYPHPEISVSALRFDFKGRFLSPRVSRKIPTSKGLHHHGLAPEAAGYTVAELAILARSAVPAQRCMAFQTLGRIMYRLGKGEWGKSEDDPIAMGVWAAIKEGRVIEALSAAASIDGGHRGSQAYATEALWLFEKGGWKDKIKGR